jgi:predicted nucleic acid-binding protein
MAGPYTIDASVFLNAFIVTESGSDVSRELLSLLQSQAVPLIAPTLLLPEVAAAISRGYHDADSARHFAARLRRLPHLILVPIDQTLALQAQEVAAQHRLRGADAVYVSVAQRFACPIVTLDCEQHDRVADVLQTFYPKELLPLWSSS